jgi:hypothetical protein
MFFVILFLIVCISIYALVYTRKHQQVVALDYKLRLAYKVYEQAIRVYEQERSEQSLKAVFRAKAEYEHLLSQKK